MDSDVLIGGGNHFGRAVERSARPAVRRQAVEEVFDHVESGSKSRGEMLRYKNDPMVAGKEFGPLV
jgi:hypothetical protein